MITFSYQPDTASSSDTFGILSVFSFNQQDYASAIRVDDAGIPCDKNITHFYCTGWGASDGDITLEPVVNKYEIEHLNDAFAKLLVSEGLL